MRVTVMLFPDLPTPQAPTPDEARRLTKEILYQAMPDAARTLWAGCAGNADNDQIKAAQAILDRTGFPARASMVIEDSRMAEYDALTDDELYALIARSRTTPGGDDTHVH